jgi:lipopolysaccharide/colanic/teichoic acid biosynthesis glycosyltransferase
VIPIGIILAEAGDVAAAIAEILFITLMSLVAYAIRHSPKSRGWFRGIVIAIAWHTFWLCVFAALRWLL